MKITIIAGARPNFMKIAPLMRAINAAKAAGKNISARLVYTGSDEDKSLEPSLFTDLDMPRPDAYLRVDDTDFFQRMAGAGEASCTNCHCGRRPHSHYGLFYRS